MHWTGNLICVASLFSLIRGDDAHFVANILQVLTVTFGWKEIDKKVVFWCAVVAYGAIAWAHIDLIVLIFHAVHFACFSGFFLYINYLLFDDCFGQKKNQKIA